MTKMEILEQVKLANEIVRNWPAWEKNILEHSLQPTNSVPRAPVDNRVVAGQHAPNTLSRDAAKSSSNCNG